MSTHYELTNSFRHTVPEAPKNVTGHNVSSTSIRVLWNPVPTERVHGLLRGYNISYMSQESHDNVWLDQTVNANTTWFIIKDLKKYTPYLVQVYGFNRREEGLPSKAIIVWTDEDGEKIKC